MAIISHGQARRIASEWHGGQRSALYSLASAGHVDTAGVTECEVVGNVDYVTSNPAGFDNPELATRELRALLKYVRTRANMPSYVGIPWHSRWDETPATDADAEV